MSDGATDPAIDTEETDSAAPTDKPAEPAPEPRPARPVPMPGTTVHHSPRLGQATVLADQGIRADALSSALARYLPASIRLIEASAHASTIMLVFASHPAPGGASS